MKKAKGSRANAREVVEKFDVGRGAIQLAILGVLNRGPECGYRIAKELREKDAALTIQYGVLYPLLEKMEQNGFVKGRWEEGRGRNGLHIYALTAKGEEALEASRSTWLRLVRQVRSLVGAGA